MRALARVEYMSDFTVGPEFNHLCVFSIDQKLFSTAYFVYLDEKTAHRPDLAIWLAIELKSHPSRFNRIHHYRPYP